MDIGFFALVISLLTIGLLMLFSSSYAFALAYFGDSYHFIKKQVFFTHSKIGAISLRYDTFFCKLPNLNYSAINLIGRCAIVGI